MGSRDWTRMAGGFLAFLALACTNAAVGVLRAQVAGATLTGTVTDTSGALVPNAQVSIKDVSTGVARNVTTDAAGLYTAPNLLPGSYEVTASASGFATQVRSGITLTVGAQVELNLTMRVGQATQRIEVTGEAPAVQLATSSISDSVNATTVRELPLNGRDWTQLATLQPGIVSLASLQPNISSGFERGNRGFGVQMTISGARPQQNSYRLDGININDYMGGGPGSVFGASLGVDAIQEFSVLTSNYSAEYGRTSGGVINAISRSGTNQFHGDAYEFLRNSSLDAANFFDNLAGLKIPSFKRNQFGASAGGPIRKDRTFVFGDYEGLRQSLGVTTVDTVPSLDARNGIIHTQQPDGSITTCTIGVVSPGCNLVNFARTVGVDPLVQPYLPLWSLPNGGILSPGNTGIFSFASNQVTSENFVTARVDNKFSDKDTLAGSFELDKANVSLPDALNDVLIGSNTSRVFVGLEESHIFSPQLVNSFRLGFNRSTALNAFSVKAVNPLAADLSLGAVPGIAAPSINIPGVTLFPGGVNSPTHSTFALNSFQAYDDLFLTKGIHSLKIGFAGERQQLNEFQLSAAGGLFKFGSLTNFLTDQPKSFVAALPGHLSPRGLRQTILGGYIQDDVRWRPNLTVNMGLRYEMSTVPIEVQNKLSNLRNLTDPSPTVGSPLFSNPTYAYFQPRVGFAWDPFRNGKTSVRGGFGVFDVLPLLYEYQMKQFSTPPFFLQGTATGLKQGTFPTQAFTELAPSGHLRTFHMQFDAPHNYVMQWNLNLQREVTPSLTASVIYVGSRSVHLPFHVDDANMVLPTQTSAGSLWPCGPPLDSNGNCTTANGTVLNPLIGRMDYFEWNSDAFYHGLQIQITKRMSHGFQAQGSYTWSKSIDEGSATIISDPYANSITSLFWFLPKWRRAPSDFNIGQNLVINYTWNIPSPQSLHGAAAWAAGGWQLGGIVTVQTGLPFTPLIGGDPLGLNSADAFAYPDHLSGPGCHTAVNPGNVNNYINLNCFGLPTAPASLAAECAPFAPNGGAPLAGTCSNLLGNSGRNSVIGPGLATFDFSLFKNNYVRRISENFNVQFRAEFFNLLNRPNFASPIANSTLFDQTGAAVGGAGFINQTTTTAREIQFALKVIW